MASPPAATSGPTTDSAAAPAPTVASSLPPEALALAARLYDAARAGDEAVLAQALAAGLPANMTNEKGDSLLMLAAYHGHASVVSLLIRQGADPNQLNDRGQSPLAGAIFKKEDEVVEVLLQGGADPDHGHPSALACLAMFGQEEKWGAKFEAAKSRAPCRAAVEGSR